MNSSLIENSPKRSDIQIIKIKATDIAEDLGNTQVANMVMLGALIGKTGIIKPHTISKALREITPLHKKTLTLLNEKAFKRGFKEIAD